MFVFLAAAAGAGVVASHFVTVNLRRQFPAAAGGYRCFLCCFLPDKSDMVYGVDDIMADGGQESLEQVMPFPLIGYQRVSLGYGV